MVLFEYIFCMFAYDIVKTIEVFFQNKIGFEKLGRRDFLRVELFDSDIFPGPRENYPTPSIFKKSLKNFFKKWGARFSG